LTLAQSIENYKHEIGEPYDYISLVGKMPLTDIEKMIKEAIKDNEKWIQPVINITYQAMASAGNWKKAKLQNQLKVIQNMIKSEKTVNEKINKLPKDEPLAIINEIQREKQPDYTRALTIAGIVFTGLMLLLIWRIGK